MKYIVLAAAVISGCMDKINEMDADAGSVPRGKASYLCVGMEKSARFGSCAGCERDARRLSSLMEDKFGYRGDVLISADATRSAVIEKLVKGIGQTEEDGLFLFFYAGHGGQEALGGKEPDGADRQDEYLCLYDAHLLDDEIWEIIRTCKGRVFLYFDACHSATMYRGVSSTMWPEPGMAKAMSTGDMVRSKGFVFHVERFVLARAMSTNGDPELLRMLCWSGCKELESSYGSMSGGTMTSAVIGAWNRGVSYGKLWSKATEVVKRLQSEQNPVQTRIGDGFPSSMEAFR